eukprot:1285583-Pyramimonas_sp.AAC.1
MPLAGPNQCGECYGIWVPLSLCMTWSEFCEKYTKDEDFKRRVKAAVRNPSKLQIYYSVFLKQDVANAQKFGIELARHGSFLTEAQ